MSGFDWRGGPCFAHDLAGGPVGTGDGRRHGTKVTTSQVGQWYKGAGQEDLVHRPSPPPRPWQSPGTVHCDFYSTTLSRVAAYRLYDDSDMFSAPPGTPFVVTFTVNDQNFAVASAVNVLLGVTFYYA